jgi:SAM-dependent methyltransferase
MFTLRASAALSIDRSAQARRGREAGRLLSRADGVTTFSQLILWEDTVNAAERQAHWQNVYAAKGEAEVSWFQENPAPSLELIVLAGAGSRPAIVDIGGGASRLVDHLILQGFEDLTVLDLSATALDAAKARIGEKASQVHWLVADVTAWTPPRLYDVWHDRAAFHFLTDPADQAAYVARLRRALRPGGCAIIGSFALNGPERCSGLPVARYDAESLGEALGPGFALVDARRHDHLTPWGATQHFQFSTFRFGREVRAHRNIARPRATAWPGVR